MKNIFLLSLIIIVAISCSKQVDSANANSQAITNTIEHSDITVSEFNMSFTEKDSSVVIIDVRTAREYDDGNIPNSVQIDLMSPDFKSEISRLDRSKTYIVYCQVGARSTTASKIMARELGFSDVKNLSGGYSAWSKEN